MCVLLQVAICQQCQIDCPAHQYAHTVALSYLPHMAISPNFRQSQYFESIFIGSLSAQTSSRTITTCKNCETDMDIDTFDFVRAECDDEEPCFELEHTCRAKCREHYVAKNNTCVLCNHTSCETGSYMTTQDCGICAPCSTNFMAVLKNDGSVLQDNITNYVDFVSNGANLDDAFSCLDKCKAGYFEDAGMIDGKLTHACVQHTVPSCTATQYLIEGTATADARCEECRYHCPEQHMLSNCTNTAQSVCEKCNGELQAHEKFAHSNCSVTCIDGAIRNLNGVCELCSSTCAVGQKRAANASTCDDCVSCDTMPLQNAHYVQGCVWSCNDTFAFNASSNTCEDVSTSISYARVVVAKDFKYKCDLGQYLKSNVWSFSVQSRTTCASCNDRSDVLTPSSNDLGLTWNWVVLNGQQCAWQCNNGHYKYFHDSNSVSCYTWRQYASLSDAVGSTEVLLTSEEQEIKFEPAPKQETKTVSEWQVALMCVCAICTCRYLLQ